MVIMRCRVGARKKLVVNSLLGSYVFIINAVLSVSQRWVKCYISTLGNRCASKKNIPNKNAFYPDKNARVVNRR